MSPGRSSRSYNPFRCGKRSNEHPASIGHGVEVVRLQGFVAEAKQYAVAEEAQREGKFIEPLNTLAGEGKRPLATINESRPTLDRDAHHFSFARKYMRQPIDAERLPKKLRLGYSVSDI